MKSNPLQDVALPRDWPKNVKSCILNIISMAYMAMIYVRSAAANSINARVRLQAKFNRANNEIALLKEEIRIKDARMNRISSHRRPYYTCFERMAILELKAARGLSAKQAAKVFNISAETIASWNGRIDEQGSHSLLRTTEPVNKYPQLVGYIVKRLKTLCPTMGKLRIAQSLTYAGMSLCASTASRMLKHTDKEPDNNDLIIVEEKSSKQIIAKQVNHIWHIDLTTIPTTTGFWVSWFPFSLLQQWPFCWWMGCVVDNYSRAVVGFALFKKKPTSIEFQQFLARAFKKAGAIPKHIISDKDSIFGPKFKAWCKQKKNNINLRYGAVGKHGSIVIIERFFRSIKQQWLRTIMIPLQLSDMRNSITTYIRWYNHYRPHQGLNGAIPIDLYSPDKSKKAPKQYDPRGRPDMKLKLIVTYFEGHKQLPIVELKQVA